MDNFFLNALFTAGCSNAMGIPRRAFSQSSCFWTHQREAKFSSTGVCWSPSKYQATRMPLNDCHAAVIKRGKRNLMCCKEDAVKGLQRWSMQTRDTLEMVSRWVPGLGPKWRRGCRRTRWTQKKNNASHSVQSLWWFSNIIQRSVRGGPRIGRKPKPSLSGLDWAVWKLEGSLLLSDATGKMEEW